MEREFHQWLKSQVRYPSSVRVGIGDDAAVLSSNRSLDGTPSQQVLTTDAIAEGTHFDLSSSSLLDVGRKAVGVNLSDIAAMGASPTAAVISLMLPRQFTLEQAREIFLGCKMMADQFDTPIVGGDTNRWDGKLVVSVTILGCTRSRKNPGQSDRGGQENFWRISGARQGDRIVVSGSFGGSILGRHLRFEPRISLAEYLMENYRINGATDVSDSLSLDLALMAQASNETSIDSDVHEPTKIGVEVYTAKIPLSPDAILLSQSTKKEACIHALIDGEDFELAFAIAPDELKLMQADRELKAEFVPLTEIGYFGSQPGFWLLTDGGDRQRFEPRGYSH